MASDDRIGTVWTDDELDLIVADYFAMLALDAAHQPFVKAHRARALGALTGRVHKSIEFKHMNISAVAAELGLPTVRGYRPMANYQAAIFPAIDRYLSAHPEVLSDDALQILPHWGWSNDRMRSDDGTAERWRGPAPDTPFPGVAEPATVFDGGDGAIRPLTLSQAPPPGPHRTPRPEGLTRLVRKYDPAARDHRNRALGRLGEEHVLHHERTRLIAADRPDLARKIEWTSQERGDGAGYDIRSFDPTGAPLAPDLIRGPDRGQGHPRRPHHPLLPDPHPARGLTGTPGALAPLSPPRPLGRAGTVRVAAVAGGGGHAGGGDVAGGVLISRFSPASVVQC